VVALRLIDAVAEVIIARMRSRQRRQVLSVITLLRRAAKILLLAFTAVGVLDTFGINVTTGIAALGIGGIALALGAQKTVENLVGSVTVIIDQPVQVGDFCKWARFRARSRMSASVRPASAPTTARW
jgi:MscS family membrane protein